MSDDRDGKRQRLPNGISSGSSAATNDPRPNQALRGGGQPVRWTMVPLPLLGERLDDEP